MKKLVLTALLLGAVWGGARYFFSAPTVSVVMPVYNREELVGRAIDSILTQTYTDFELIIVDDGSTDGTPRILKDYAALDKRIKVITNEKNHGIPFSRNRGAAAATGKYIALMDSDDYSLPDRLKKSVRFLKEHPEVDALTGGIREMRENAETFTFTTPDYNEPDDNYRINKTPGWYEVDLNFYNNFFNVPAIYKRKFAEQNLIKYRLDYKAAEDYDFWMQFAQKGGKFASMVDALVYVRFHHSNNPAYYQAMEANSVKIHKEGLSRFFKPEESDLAFEYNTAKKCALLKKMMAANVQKQVMPQRYLEDYYGELCPQTEDYVYLKHPFWESFMEKGEDGLWHRLQTDVTAKIAFKSGKVVVYWEGFPMEEFIHREGKTYQYRPHGEKIKLKHPGWEDEFWQNNDKSLGCREIGGDCAQMAYSEDGSELELKWLSYPPETFVKTKRAGVFEYKETLE